MTAAITRAIRALVPYPSSVGQATDRLAELLDAVADNLAAPIADEEIADLARALSSSGETLAADERAVDVASTGGPGSLSTLLCPLFLVGSGLRVAKLGVQGRPAGGIDSLGTIPGYRVQLTAADARAVIGRVGYVHLLAGELWTPADAALFTMRQERGLQGMAPLVIASLLGKKLAMGVTRAVLDIRVAAYGNFGRTTDEAISNAARFDAVGDMLGIHTTCKLSDATTAQQPALGRAEALAGMLAVVDGREDDWTHEHADECRRLARLLHGTAEVAASIGLEQVLADHLAAQGASMESLRNRVDIAFAQPNCAILAEENGVLSLDIETIRDVVVAEQRPARAAPDAAFADPAGVLLLARPGVTLRCGDPIARVRASDRARLEKLTDCVKDAITLA